MINYDTGPNNILGLVIAAGFSRRYGQDDKRKLIMPNGQTLLGQTCSRVMQWLGNVSVVIRPDDGPISLGIPEGSRILLAPDAIRGMGSSIGNAFSAILDDRDYDYYQSAAIMLADLPDWDPASCNPLLPHCHPKKIIRPTYQGDIGHPVIIGRSYWKELTQLTGNTGAKDVIKKYQDKVIQQEINHPGILADLDTPQYKR